MNLFSGLTDILRALEDYYRYEACYICNNHPIKIDYTEDEILYWPFCAECFAILPWRLTVNSVLRFIETDDNFEFSSLVCLYYRGIVRTLIRKYKFYQERNLSKLWGFIAALTCAGYRKALSSGNIAPVSSDMLHIDAVSFLPLHPARKLERSYDQAELLAIACAEYLQIPCLSTLKRQRETQRQSSLQSRSERYNNIKSAFVADDSVLIKGKNILLLDDVLSTGASLSAGVKALYDAGAYGVLAMALASNLSARELHFVGKIGNKI